MDPATKMSSEKLEAELTKDADMESVDPTAIKTDDMSLGQLKEMEVTGMENRDLTTTNRAGTSSENVESEALEVVGADVTDMEFLTTFTYFPRLPAELRVKIWNFHIGNGERLVKLQCGKHSELQPGCDMQQPLWTSSTPLPTILQINKESRHEGLKVYKQSFGGILDNFCTPNIAYFNESLDTPYLPDALAFMSWLLDPKREHWRAKEDHL